MSPDADRRRCFLTVFMLLDAPLKLPVRVEQVRGNVRCCPRAWQPHHRRGREEETEEGDRYGADEMFVMCTFFSCCYHLVEMVYSLALWLLTGAHSSPRGRPKLPVGG